MAEQKFDMEVTAYRLQTMKDILVRLYAHQMGMEVVSVKTYPINPQKEAESTGKTAG